jgi:dihydroxyacetone kinase phosphoprotein-dependent L subunit
VTDVDIEALDAWLRRAAASIRRHTPYLTHLDSVLGDGDHGDNMSLGMAAVEELLDGPGVDRSPGALLRAVGYCLVGSVGGASGPLYGTALIQAGSEVGGVRSIDAELLGRTLEAAAAALARRGRCEVGDKTIYDTLAPAVAAYRDALDDGDDVTACLSAAIHAAAAGMRSTQGLAARRGLALRLGARSVGTIDPGAMSCFLLLRAMLPRPARRPQPFAHAGTGHGSGSAVIT